MPISNLWDFVQERAKQLELADPKIRRASVSLEPYEEKIVLAHNEWYFLAEELDRLSIESRYGAYSRINHLVKTGIIEHKGKIKLSNHSSRLIRVPFYVLSE